MYSSHAWHFATPSASGREIRRKLCCVLITFLSLSLSLSRFVSFLLLQSRRQSVSFTAMPPGVLVNDSRANSTDDIQIALAPHIQTYLSQTGRRHSCCSVMLPVAFERAAAKSWLDPKFDSPVLEEQFQASVFPHIRMRYRWVRHESPIESLL